SAAYIEIGTGLPNTGTRTFNPSGNNSVGEGDWVLIIETGTTPPTPTPSPTSTATATATANPTPASSSTPTPLATAAATSTPTPVTGLVAAYSFNEGGGTTVSDASGHGLTGIIQGATWTTGGRYGNALSFDGSSSYIDL